MESNQIIRDKKGRFVKGQISLNKLSLPEKQVIGLYNKFSINVIAKKFSCSRTVIRRILNKNNIKIKSSSFFLKGKPSKLKNKKFEDIYGIEEAKIKKQNLSNKLSRRVSMRKGKFKKNIDLEQKRIFCECGCGQELDYLDKYRNLRKYIYGHNNKNKTYEEIYGEEKAELLIKKRSESRAKQVFPTKDTKIEIKIRNFLDSLKIEYFQHKHMNINHSYQCDFFIPSMNLVLEVDGDYWHGNPIFFPNPTTMQQEHINRDRIRTMELIAKGFKVLRLWECEINEMVIKQFDDRLNNEI